MWAILGNHAVPARRGGARSRRRREWGTGAAADRRVHASRAPFHRTDDPQRWQRICSRGARGAAARHRATLRLRRPGGVRCRTSAGDRGPRRGRRMAGQAAARKLRSHRALLPRIGRSAARLARRLRGPDGPGRPRPLLLHGLCAPPAARLWLADRDRSRLSVAGCRWRSSPLRPARIGRGVTGRLVQPRARHRGGGATDQFAAGPARAARAAPPSRSDRWRGWSGAALLRRRDRRRSLRHATRGPPAHLAQGSGRALSAGGLRQSATPVSRVGCPRPG